MFTSTAMGRQMLARRPFRSSLAIASLLAVTVPLFIAGSSQAAPGVVPQIEVLSNRADLVSGGDALVEVTLPERADSDDITMALDGRDVTNQFALRPNGRYMGKVTGLREGNNELTAHTSRNVGATLTITNRSQQGPVFAGDKVQPWICETEKFGLDEARGRDCVASTRFEFFYKSTATNDFEDYDRESPPPDALIANTTTDEGKTVPYIVRRERGVIDRGIYDIATLFDPDKRWRPWAPQGAWNGKVHWLFEGACGPEHRQGGVFGLTDVMNTNLLSDFPLSRGHAVVTSTLNTLGNNCNDVVSAEAMMTIKEHFVETYGPIRFTTAEGGSGGAIQQYAIANNYPGLLDGLIPYASWADIWNVSHYVHDCRQLDRYFNSSPTLWADPGDRAAITGLADGCVVIGALTHGEAWFDPRIGCAPDAPVDQLDSRANPAQHGDKISNEPEWVYDPETNPGGVRCTVQDYARPVYGQRSDGFGNRPLDEVGLQYGLISLLNGRITSEQFVDLNAKIGGRDIDYNWTPQRTRADLDGLRTAYRSGRVNDAQQLDRVPVMELRCGSNLEGGALTFHPDVYSRMVRARLISANGHADNQVIWTAPGNCSPDSATMKREAFLTLDQWLTAIREDTSTEPLETKVVRNKPIQARDTCWAAGEAGGCGTTLPYYSSARLDAGAPMRSDILKCQLQPIDWKDYGSVKFTDGQKQRLREAFPEGVCDWTKPGVEQQPAAGVWQTFADTVGGRPLGPEPQSEPMTGR